MDYIKKVKIITIIFILVFTSLCIFPKINHKQNNYFIVSGHVFNNKNMPLDGINVTIYIYNHSNYVSPKVTLIYKNSTLSNKSGYYEFVIFNINIFYYLSIEADSEFYFKKEKYILYNNTEKDYKENFILNQGTKIIGRINNFNDTISYLSLFPEKYSYTNSTLFYNRNYYFYSINNIFFFTNLIPSGYYEVFLYNNQSKLYHEKINITSKIFYMNITCTPHVYNYSVYGYITSIDNRYPNTNYSNINGYINDDTGILGLICSDENGFINVHIDNTGLYYISGHSDRASFCQMINVSYSKSFIFSSGNYEI